VCLPIVRWGGSPFIKLCMVAWLRGGSGRYCCNKHRSWARSGESPYWGTRRIDHVWRQKQRLLGIVSYFPAEGQTFQGAHFYMTAQRPVLAGVIQPVIKKLGIRRLLFCYRLVVHCSVWEEGESPFSLGSIPTFHRNLWYSTKRSYRKIRTYTIVSSRMARQPWAGVR